MSDKSNKQNRAKRQRDAVIQRLVREKDQALDELKTFAQQVNAHVGTAYNIMAAVLKYEQDENRKYQTGGKDLISLVLELVKKYQDADPSAPKIVEQRTAPVEYEEKPKVIIASAVEESKAVPKETLYEALEDIATADEREAIQNEEGDDSFDFGANEVDSVNNPASFGGIEFDDEKSECVKHSPAVEVYKDAHTHGTYDEPLPKELTRQNAEEIKAVGRSYFGQEPGPDSDSWDDYRDRVAASGGER